MKNPRKTLLLTAALALAGAGVAEARPGGGGGHSGGARSGGGHYGGGHSYSHGYRGYYRPYYGSRIVVGGGPYYPYYSYPGYAYPYPYPASSYYAPTPEYIEQPAYEQEQPQGQQGQYPQDPGASWYFCSASGQYYPHVQSCAGGWQRVPSQPPPGG